MTTEYNPSPERLEALFHAALVKMANHPQPWVLTKTEGIWAITDAAGETFAHASHKSIAEKMFEVGTSFAANFPDAFMPPDPDDEK